MSKSITSWLVAGPILVAMLLTGCSDESAPPSLARTLPSPTSVSAPMATETPIHTPTATLTPTSIPTAAATPIPTAIPTAAAMPIPTAIPTATATSTPTAIPTATAMPIPTAIPTATTTPIPTTIPTATATPIPTTIPTATATPTPVPKAESPPPTWVFAGNIPTEHQTILREEMEHSRAYFSDRFGIEATGFTVLVGADYEAMSPVFRDVTGKDLSWAYGSHLKRTHAWVGSSASGGAVVGLMYGHLSDRSLSILKHAIVHEYFHVLQGQLGSGFAQLQNGEIAWGFPRDRGPTWLVEGLASYADYAYTPSRPGRRQFLDDRYRPYLDLAWQRAIESDALDNLAMELARIEDRFAFRACSGQWHSYALSFIASTFLVEEQSESEDSYVNYWRLLGERATWQQAFEEAFGISVDNFYTAFDEGISSSSSPLPPFVRLKLQLRWPDMETQSTDFHGGPSFEIEEGGTWEGTRPTSLLMSSSPDGTLYVIYPEGAVGSGYLSLWWSDDMCTYYLRGWYRDGELTTQREDATMVEFTGISANIDWNVPAHPGTLLRLGCTGCDCAGF